MAARIYDAGKAPSKSLIACRPRQPKSSCTARCLVPVVVGLVGAIDGHAKVVGLVLGELGQLDVLCTIKQAMRVSDCAIHSNFEIWLRTYDVET